MANRSGTYSTDLGLGLLPESKNRDDFPDMLRIYNALRALAANLDAYTGNVPAAAQPQRIYTGSPISPACTSGVALGVGSCVSFATSTTTLTATLADATLGIAPDGISIAASAAGTPASIITSGLCKSFTGLTPGQRYYLQAGGALGLAPSAYLVGIAFSPTTLWLKL